MHTKGTKIHNMTLYELAVEYRESGERCRRRVRELQDELDREAMGETERLLLRRRISVLSAMERDAIATSRYLEHYYGRNKGDVKADDGGRL